MTRFKIGTVESLLTDEGFAAALARAEDDGVFASDLIETCSRAGLFALAVPLEHGGLELSLRRRAELHTLVGPLSASLQSILTVHEMAVVAIVRFGRPSLRERWLPAMGTGACRGAFALTEPGGGGFDQVECVARRQPSGIVVDGTKSWVSSGLGAGVVVVLAQAGDGPTAVAVPGDAPGLTAARSPEVSAFRAASLASLRFERCIVDPGDILGGHGLGFVRVATACLSVGRVLVGSGAIGLAKSALDALIAHANNRTVGRQALAAHDLVRQAVADSYVRIKGAELLVWEAASLVDRRVPGSARDAIVAKLAASDAAIAATHAAVRLHGAAGLTSSSLVRRYAAESLVYGTIEGTLEALTTALGSDLLRAGARPVAGAPT